MTTIANTYTVYARIDTNLKEDAGGILSQLSISPSCAIQMLYSQIVLVKWMSFDFRLPIVKPVSIGGMTLAQLYAELAVGIESMKTDKAYSADEVDAKFARGSLVYDGRISC